jgi:hypothetical protein
LGEVGSRILVLKPLLNLIEKGLVGTKIFLDVYRVFWHFDQASIILGINKMKHIFVAISLAFLSSSPVLASDGGEKKRIQFSEEEDAQLRELVAQYGARSWDAIAQNMPGRCAGVCRGRWVHHLVQPINNSPWTPEEDNFLIVKLQEIGRHWTQISNFFNRTDVQVRLRILWLIEHAEELGIVIPTDDSHGFPTEERVSFVVPMISTTPTDRRGLGDSDLWEKLGVNL